MYISPDTDCVQFLGVSPDMLKERTISRRSGMSNSSAASIAKFNILFSVSQGNYAE